MQGMEVPNPLNRLSAPWEQAPPPASTAPWEQGPPPTKPMTFINESAYMDGSQAEWMGMSQGNPTQNYRLSITTNSTGTGTTSSHGKYNPTFESNMSPYPPGVPRSGTPMQGAATHDSVTNYATQQGAWAPMVPPAGDVTMQDKKEYLEEQVDQLVNRVLGGWLLVLPGTDNRASGGSYTTYILRVHVHTAHSV